MTSSEIRALPIREGGEDIFYREIAAQLADFNEFMRKERGDTSAQVNKEETPSGGTQSSQDASPQESSAQPSSTESSAQPATQPAAQ